MERYSVYGHFSRSDFKDKPNNSIRNFKSFKFKFKFTGNNNTEGIKNVEIAASLNRLINFLESS